MFWICIGIDQAHGNCGAAFPIEPRDRLSVAFRLVLAIPHSIVLVFVLCAWGITTILAWFVILITGCYPRALFDFGAGALGWRLRVESYLLLMVDVYPPFSLR